MNFEMALVFSDFDYESGDCYYTDGLFFKAVWVDQSVMVTAEGSHASQWFMGDEHSSPDYLALEINTQNLRRETKWGDPVMSDLGVSPELKELILTRVREELLPRLKIEPKVLDESDTEIDWV